MKLPKVTMISKRVPHPRQKNPADLAKKKLSSTREEFFRKFVNDKNAVEANGGTTLVEVVL